MIRVTFVSLEERRLFDAFRTYVGPYIIFPNVFSTTDRQLFAQSQLAQVLLWSKQRLFTEIVRVLMFGSWKVYTCHAGKNYFRAHREQSTYSVILLLIQLNTSFHLLYLHLVHLTVCNTSPALFSSPAISCMQNIETVPIRNSFQMCIYLRALASSDTVVGCWQH